MKAFFQEFKNFAVQGNVIDVAVGVVIGAAFGKITTSLVTNIIMPPIGILLGGFFHSLGTYVGSNLGGSSGTRGTCYCLRPFY